MIDKIKISIVSYLNAKPFVNGLLSSEQLENKIVLEMDVPSVCAKKVSEDKVDIGLVPVAALSDIVNAKIISNFCIGSVGDVMSVILASDVPMQKIKTVLLDNESVTSVSLARILAKEYWNITPDWVGSTENIEYKIKDNTGGVVIGDKALRVRLTHQYIYDLSNEWYKMTGLPFVFAVWVANKDLPKNFLNDFNTALSYGISQKERIISGIDDAEKQEQASKYLAESISYNLDQKKKMGLELFLKKLENYKNKKKTIDVI